MAWTNKRIPMGPTRPAPAKKAASTEQPSDAHGKEVAPHRVVSESGWLRCPENERAYDGDNRPWRR